MPDDALAESNIDDLYAQKYEQTIIVQRLQHEVDDARDDPDVMLALADELMAAEDRLYQIQQAIDAAEKEQAEAEAEAGAEEAVPRSFAPGEEGRPPRTTRSGRRKRGPLSTGHEVQRYRTTGLEFDLRVHLPQAPTAIYHLLDPEQDPLISCVLNNTARAGRPARRLLVRAWIEGYSAEAVQTVEATPQQPATVRLLPPLFPERVENIHALTRGMLHVTVEDIGNKRQIEQYVTESIWLLAKTSAPQAVKDPVTGEWNDLTRYLGAYVTPGEPSIMRFLRKVADRHPNGRLVGYQSEVESQAKAIYDALKEDAQMTYVDSLIDFNPEGSVRSQRVRLPRESLADRTANCIDGVLLFASLLEGVSINPCIALVPGHAFVGWETGRNNNDWQYLETTMLQTHDFYKALDIGNRRAASYIKRYENTRDPAWFRRWSLRELRVEHGILPME